MPRKPKAKRKAAAPKPQTKVVATPRRGASLVDASGLFIYFSVAKLMIASLA